MPRAMLSIILTLWFMTPVNSFAEEQMSFKGIKFGMKAAEIAKLAGGDLEFGCASAITDDENPWTYGGIDDWSASCVEGRSESKRVPGTSGLYQLSSIASSHKNALAKWADEQTYAVEELVEVFSRVFGKFEIDTKVVKNGLGEEFIKKHATATRGGAVMHIADNTSGSNHEDYIILRIISLDYSSKEAAWENEQSSQKLKGAKSDF